MYFQYRGILRKLAADDVAGLAALYPLHPPTPTATPPPGSSPTPPAETLTLLEPGWNLLVLPPSDTGALAAALPCLEALYLWRDEAWTAWVRGMPAALQGFAAVDGSRAYWALSRSSCAHVFS
jgi:hypothetical protein